MKADWARFENQVINGVFPLHRSLSCSDHSAVFLTECRAQNAPTAVLKLVPAIPTLREAQLSQWTTAATLSHPHLIRLMEAGSCRLGGLQFLFVVMEYAEATLAQILTRRAVAPEELREMLVPTLATLSFLHRRQLVQGQLKPANILFVNGKLKLASDAVRPSGESTASIAQASIYDPPESGDGSFLTAGDIWGLGVSMVEALTQHRPTWPNKQSATAAFPTTVPATFARIVRQCLSRSPANRPTVADLEAQIRPIPRPPVLQPEHSPQQPVISIPGPVGPEERNAFTRARKSPKQRSMTLAVAVAFSVSIAAWAGLRLSGPEPASRLAALSAARAQTAERAQADSAGAAPAVGSAASAPAPGLAEPTEPVASAPVIHEEVPDIPRHASETIHGRILLAVRVTIDSSGDVIHAKLERRGPSPYFARMAAEAAEKWKFAREDDPSSRHWLLQFEFTRDGVTAHAGPRRNR
jgi:Protein kinase domain